jgi:hypothetical protein
MRLPRQRPLGHGGRRVTVAAAALASVLVTSAAAGVDPQGNAPIGDGEANAVLVELGLAG